MNTPAHGTISQRRKAAPPPLPGASMGEGPSTSHAIGTASNLPQVRISSSLPPNSNVIMGAVRGRATSQPGHRPPLPPGFASYDGSPPVRPMHPMTPAPMTPGVNTVMRKASYPSHLTNPSGSSPVSSFASTLVTTAPCIPTSALPPMPPSDPLRKPYHLMAMLRQSMTAKTGGYVTRRLHVPHDVWTQTGAKLSNLAEKIRVLEILSSALEEVQASSQEFTGGSPVNAPVGSSVLSPQSANRPEGERWITKLDEWGSVCDGIVSTLGKKLGVGEGFVIKKTSGVCAPSTPFPAPYLHLL